MNKSFQRRDNGFAEVGILVVAVAILAVAGFYAYKNMHTQNQATSTVKTLRHVPAISSLVFATGINAAGAPVGTSEVFLPSTPTIYAVAGVANAGANARIEYIRYLNDKFIDNGSMAVTKQGSKYAGFGFSLKPGAVHPSGMYKLKVYANGKFIRQAVYAVK